MLDYATIKSRCEAQRDAHAAMRRAKPQVFLYTNKPDGSAGLILRGRCTNSNQSGDFPFRKTATTFGDGGVLVLPLDHHLARWLITIPNDNAVKKNVVIRVDHMQGYVRWTGLLRNWKVVKKGGLYQLQVNFISDPQFMQFLLGAPCPPLPLEIFQFPRDLPIFGPTKWACALMILLNLIRIEGNLWNIPPDPFAPDQWDALVDWNVWQVLIKNSPFDLDDSSLWTFLTTRMTRMDTVIQDALDDAQCVMQWRRYFTDEGETVPGGVPLADDPANGVLVLEIVDMSGFYAPDGTYTGGALADGFFRTIRTFIAGGVEDVEAFVADNESFPNDYYTPGFLGPGDPTIPFVVVHDSKYSAIDTAELTWAPARAPGVIVGGDNPLVDQAARLLIESIGAIAGYFLLAGFSGLGSIIADVVMPFIQGTIFAWDQYTHNARAHELGWAHLWEVNGGNGTTINAWSLGAVVAIRAALEANKSESSHRFSMGMGGRWFPGLHMLPGSRIGSVFSRVSDQILVDQLEEMTLGWDYSEDKMHDYVMQVGLSNQAMTLAERQARLINKIFNTMSDIGVHIFS